MRVLTAHDVTSPQQAFSEADTQSLTRLSISRQGAMAWRNNVGVTPSRCPHCDGRLRPVRYGLANDSAALNKRVKSHDLILAIPRLITPGMVGTTIAQFGSVECKKAGWRYTGQRQEGGQMAWAALIKKLGGYAAFSTGDVKL